MTHMDVIRHESETCHFMDLKSSREGTEKLHETTRISSVKSNAYCLRMKHADAEKVNSLHRKWCRYMKA